MAAATAAGRRIKYEATVGAGLPIIDTYQKLVETGDRVLQHRRRGQRHADVRRVGRVVWANRSLKRSAKPSRRGTRNPIRATTSTAETPRAKS